ncbi:unnamed protein product [Arctogadus glacialis]
MGEWSFLGDLFEHLQAHSPMLGRFWLFIMLVFRILILGTVASDLFDDEQEEFSCNTLQPGCKQVCYDHAFPISLYRFWVFHIILISTPAMLYLMYAMHHVSKKKPPSSADGTASTCSQDNPEERRLRQLYLVNVAFRLMAEVGVLVGQWWLYGFKLESQFPCSRYPCPYTVDCFTSRPAEKTVFLVFYFGVGVVSAASSLVELLYAAVKWFCPRKQGRRGALGKSYDSHSLSNLRKQEEEANLRFVGGGKALSDSALSSARMKAGPVRSSGARKTSSVGHKTYRLPSSRSFMAFCLIVIHEHWRLGV